MDIFQAVMVLALVAICAVGFISILIPLKFLLIKTRFSGALVFLGGLGTLVAASLWLQSEKQGSAIEVTTQIQRQIERRQDQPEQDQPAQEPIDLEQWEQEREALDQREGQSDDKKVRSTND